MNVEEIAIERTIPYLQDKPNWTKLLKVFSAVLQSLFDKQEEFLQKFEITQASGDQLVKLGENYVLSKGELLEEEFRALILVAPFKYAKAGEINTVINAFKEVTQASNVVYAPLYPASYTLYAFCNNIPVQATEIIKEMNDIKPAGVEQTLVIMDDEFPLFLSTDTEAGGYLSTDTETGDPLGVSLC